MKIAITGGTGFVGGHLARALVRAGHRAVLISRGFDLRDQANGLAWLTEKLMVTPLVSLAQVRILSEGVVEPLPPCDLLPDTLRPQLPFAEEQIRQGLPEPGPLGWADLRWFAPAGGDV